MENFLPVCRHICLLCRCLAGWLIPPTAGFMHRQPFSMFLFGFYFFFPCGSSSSSSSAPTFLRTVRPDAVTGGNGQAANHVGVIYGVFFFLFGGSWYEIGHLWEFQRWWSHRRSLRTEQVEEETQLQWWLDAFLEKMQRSSLSESQQIRQEKSGWTEGW